MPYINSERRLKYDLLVEDVIQHVRSSPSGDINYYLSKIIWGIFDLHPSYITANELIGVLECVKQEFYRRKVAPYEDTKITANGDL